MHSFLVCLLFFSSLLLLVNCSNSKQFQTLFEQARLQNNLLSSFLNNADHAQIVLNTPSIHAFSLMSSLDSSVSKLNSVNKANFKTMSYSNCQSAIQNLTTIGASCNSISSLFNFSTPGSVLNNIDGICSSSCISNIAPAALAVNKECADVINFDAFDTLQLRRTLLVFKAICVTLDDQPYSVSMPTSNKCAAVALDNLRSVGNAITNYAKNNPDSSAPPNINPATYCVPCLDKFVRAFAQAGGFKDEEAAKGFRFVDILCSQDLATKSYCYTDLVKVSTAFAKNNSDFSADTLAGPTSPLNLLCRPCVRKAFTNFLAAVPGDNPFGSSFDKFFSVMCAKDYNGQFCIGKIANVFSDATVAISAGGYFEQFDKSHAQDNGALCSGMNIIQEKLDCCFGQLFQFYSIVEDIANATKSSSNSGPPKGSTSCDICDSSCVYYDPNACTTPPPPPCDVCNRTCFYWNPTDPKCTGSSGSSGPSGNSASSPPISDNSPSPTSGSTTVSMSGDSFFSWGPLARDRCGISIGGCERPAYFRITFGLSNIKPSWYNANTNNQEQFKQAVQTDIANSLGLPTSAVIVETVSLPNTSPLVTNIDSSKPITSTDTQLTVRVSGDTISNTAALGTVVSTDVSTIQFNSVAALPLSSRAQATSSPSATVTQAATVEIQHYPNTANSNLINNNYQFLFLGLSAIITILLI